MQNTLKKRIDGSAGYTIRCGVTYHSQKTKYRSNRRPQVGRNHRMPAQQHVVAPAVIRHKA